MTDQEAVLCATDFSRLQELIEDAKVRGRGYAQTAALANVMAAARIRAPFAVPEDVVTMNSTVMLQDLGTNARELHTIVFPEYEDAAKHWMSVLRPVAIAILGRRVGAIVASVDPAIRVKIENLVYQPERAGYFEH
jgi:regulator of nucleoside diphosphate kinase